MSLVQVAVLLRALDQIADNAPELRPGHVGYMSKANMIENAQAALAAVRSITHMETQ